MSTIVALFHAQGGSHKSHEWFCWRILFTMPGQDDQIANQIAEIYNLPDKKKKASEEPAEKTKEI